MKYTIKAHPTMYSGVQFRSRLEARYAAFFDLALWDWEYEPIDLPGWSPDFRVEFPCGHSECSNTHVLLVEIKPYHTMGEFDGHPCLDYEFGGYPGDKQIPADASAAFGNNPRISQWCMAHGAGGGFETLENGWVRTGDVQELWKKAGNIVQWHPKRRA
jgi:hypothetical protein